MSLALLARLQLVAAAVTPLQGFAYCQWAALGLALVMAVGGSPPWEKEPEALSWVRIPARRHVGIHKRAAPLTSIGFPTRDR